MASTYLGVRQQPRGVAYVTKTTIVSDGTARKSITRSSTGGTRISTTLVSMRCNAESVCFVGGVEKNSPATLGPSGRSPAWQTDQAGSATAWRPMPASWLCPLLARAPATLAALRPIPNGNASLLTANECDLAR